MLRTVFSGEYEASEVTSYMGWPHFERLLVLVEKIEKSNLFNKNEQSYIPTLDKIWIV
jgi:hypothetical protein